MPIELGQEVKDRISGFKGIAVARTTYLQGCDRIAVQPSVNKAGEMPDIKVFDEPDLLFAAEGVSAVVERPKSTTGGPRFAPEQKGSR